MAPLCEPWLAHKFQNLTTQYGNNTTRVLNEAVATVLEEVKSTRQEVAQHSTAGVQATQQLQQELKKLDGRVADLLTAVSRSNAKIEEQSNNIHRFEKFVREDIRRMQIYMTDGQEGLDRYLSMRFRERSDNDAPGSSGTRQVPSNRPVPSASAPGMGSAGYAQQQAPSAEPPSQPQPQPGPAQQHAPAQPPQQQAQPVRAQAPPAQPIVASRGVGAVAQQGQGQGFGGNPQGRDRGFRRPCPFCDKVACKTPVECGLAKPFSERLDIHKRKRLCQEKICFKPHKFPCFNGPIECVQCHQDHHVLWCEERAEADGMNY